jgi:hypothetical protein
MALRGVCGPWRDWVDPAACSSLPVKGSVMPAVGNHVRLLLTCLRDFLSAAWSIEAVPQLPGCIG